MHIQQHLGVAFMGHNLTDSFEIVWSLDISNAGHNYGAGEEKFLNID